MGNIVLKITAVLFGIALWFLVISQKDFQLTLDAPLQFVKLPANMAVASKPPQTINITVEGKSWDLIRLRHQFENSRQNAVAMVVDLQKAELGATRIHLDGKNFVAPNFPDVRFVEPDNQLLFLDLDLDAKIVRNIPIKSNIQFSAAPGYLLADVPSISPEELKVFGARNALTRIIDIPTDSVIFDSLTTSQKFNIPLDFASLPAFVTPSDSTIQVSVNIQKMERQEFHGVPVNLIGFYDKNKYYLDPDTVSVEITGGKQALDSISFNNILLVLEYNRFAIEDVDSLPPTAKLILPPNVNREMAIKAIQITPEKIKLQTKVEKPAEVQPQNAQQNGQPTAKEQEKAK